jgi:hypothetical protein
MGFPNIHSLNLFCTTNEITLYLIKRVELSQVRINLKLSFPEALADSAAYIHYETNLHRFLTEVIWPVGIYASMSASAKKFTTPSSAPSGSSPQSKIMVSVVGCA